ELSVTETIVKLSKAKLDETKQLTSYPFSQLTHLKDPWRSPVSVMLCREKVHLKRRQNCIYLLRKHAPEKLRYALHRCLRQNAVCMIAILDLTQFYPRSLTSRAQALFQSFMFDCVSEDIQPNC